MSNSSALLIIILIDCQKYATGSQIRASHEPDAATEMAASRKEDKYVDLGARYIFEPIAVETLGIFNASARRLQADIGRRISILARL